MCGKIVYISRRQARTHAPGHHGRPYICPECGYYHVGKMAKRKQRAFLRVLRLKREFRPMLRLIENMCGVS